ncbi:MAG: NADH-quinone oxidoreductase subunit C [Actinobacteria bacterium]|nr:NADH-quinone oxidoreductase subunit C [Actinomycetota bacterium]
MSVVTSDRSGDGAAGDGRARPRTPLAPAAMAAHLRERLGDRVLDTTVAHDQLTVTVRPQALPVAAGLCKRDPRLALDFFDFLAGVDAAEGGFAVVVHLYSTVHRHHVTLRALADGGRERPTLPSLTGVYRGANWHEREAYDMFGIEFTGHPGLLPRLLTVEQFEGWPLRKEFLLTSREVKAWPGAKEPEEQRAEGDAPEPAADRETAAKAKAERAKRKAAEMRARKRAAAADREARASASSTVPAEDGASPLPDTDAPDSPMTAAEAAGTDVAKDAAAGAPGGDVLAGAPGDMPDVDEPVDVPGAEADVGKGAPPTPSGAPGEEQEGLREGRPSPPTPAGEPDVEARGDDEREEDEGG